MSRPSPRVVAPAAGVATYLAAYASWQVFGWGGSGARALIGDLAFLPVYSGAAAMAWLAARRCAEVPMLRSAWLLIAVGEVFYVLGIVAQSYYEIVAGEKPFPSLADPGYLMFAPFAFAGLLRFPHSRATRGQWVRTLIDCAIVAVAGGAVIWYVLLGPAALSGESPLQLLVSVAAPVGDLLLIGGLATAVLRRTVPASEPAMRALAAGLLFVIAADLGYGWLSLHDAYNGGDPIDGLYMIGFAMFLIGAALQRPPDPAQDQGHVPETERTSWMPWIAVAILFILLAVAVWNQDPVHEIGLLAATVVVVGLVAARHLSAAGDLLTANRDLERAHAELDALAATDPVTLLPNHRALIAAINGEIARAKRKRSSCGLMFLDIDHFKTLNDSWGHAAGDTALRELGAVARSCLRGVDTVGRWGGEEFVVLLPDTGRVGALVAAERLRSAVAAHRFAGNAAARLTCSLGVAVYPEDGRTRGDLLASADRAMYTAKRFGRNQMFAASDPAVGALDALPGQGAPDEDALTGAVEALALLVDERDSYTGAHAADVAGISRRLALELGCDSATTSAVGLAARLHDIGKVAVPDAILLKPGRLTDAEWAHIHKHPIVGAEVLSRIPILRPIVPAVRAHHERWDGSGYPDGVAGEDIPLGARIISVADAFDAMVTARPYSEAIDPEEALAEIRRCSGTQFDPQVVAAMDRTLCEWGATNASTHA